MSATHPRRVRRRRGRVSLIGIAILLALAGCSVLQPLPPRSTLEGRLAAFPKAAPGLDGPVKIHWNAHQVPFIVAESDGDAAFALGLVHAHLRLGQLEAVRRISQGRLSEMVGPLGTDIDHALRVLDLGRAAPGIEARLPDDTRAWLARFLDGLNHYVETAETLPHEFTVLGLEREPWTLHDLVTIGRLAAVDVNWFVWFQVWTLREREDWPEIWRELAEAGSASMTSFAAAEGDRERLAALLGGYGRNGSNSFAVHGSRTESGHALIANDPHLGFLLPNVWLMAGVKSPSYHMVGLMVPGLPFIAVGRNPHIAWGGTNMRAASSDLFDVSDLPPEAIETRTEEIGVRWWFDSEATVRTTPFGPVISDIPLLETDPADMIALRWLGHDATDEFSAMLAANRATDWAGFRGAFESFAVSAQNMLYADDRGNIGQVMAVQVPARADDAPVLVQSTVGGGAAWKRIVTATEFPTSFNPPQGFLASANNRPAETIVPVGYFFSSDDRIARLSALLGENERLDLADAIAIQTDVFQPSSLTIRDAVQEIATRLGLEERLDARQRAVLDAMRAWDGHYRIEARGPVAYEAFLHHLLEGLYAPRFPDGTRTRFTGVAHLGVMVPRALAATPDARLRRIIPAALAEAAPALEAFASWGEMHRLTLGHPMSQIPLIGARYRFADLPAAGARQTVMKTNAAPSDEKHRAGYGSQARHISDMADPDANYFVLLGGQDGWLNSDTFIDQVALWQAHDYIHLPLRLETVQRTFPHVTVVESR